MFEDPYTDTRSSKSPLLLNERTPPATLLPESDTSAPTGGT